MSGDIYNQVGDKAASLQVFLALWKVSADDSVARAELAERFVRSATSALGKRDTWTAERFYRRAIVLDEQSVPAAAGLARTLTRFDLHAAASRWAERATRLDPDSVQAALATAESAIGAGQKRAAEAALTRLQQLAPRHAQLSLLRRKLTAI